MKTVKIILLVVIFLATFYAIKSNLPVGIDRVPLSDYPAGFGKAWITFYFVICPATICAAIPFAPEILKKIFRRSWEV